MLFFILGPGVAHSSIMGSLKAVVFSEIGTLAYLLEVELLDAGHFASDCLALNTNRTWPRY